MDILFKTSHTQLQQSAGLKINIEGGGAASAQGLIAKIKVSSSSQCLGALLSCGRGGES